MNLVASTLIWAALIASVHCEEETEEEKFERITSELKLTDWDLGDYYEGITSTRKSILTHKEPFTEEINLIAEYAQYLTDQSITFQKIPEDDIPYEYTRNYSILLKPGDALLNKTDYRQLVTFAKDNDHLSRTLLLSDPDDPEKKIGKQAYLNILATSRNVAELNETWSNWQDGISKYAESYANVLNLTKEAASRNELYDTKAYWEMLSEYEDGYQKVETLWNEIEPTYRKLHEFVLDRINNYYESNYTDIPVYLTGTNFGEDWSNLAEMVVPHQQMYKDAKFAFEVKTIQDMYRLAEKCGYHMGFGNLTKKFWSKKNFEYEICEPTLLSYPSAKYSEVLTCKNLTWISYLDAHEAVIKAGLKGVDYQALPRRELRYSAFDEALANLGTIFAIHNLPLYGLTPESDYVNMENATEHGLAAKLLLALRIFPKLAYYVAADFWRLEELDYPSDNLRENWWDSRRKYQGLESITGEEPDFLEDPYITANKPYLAKFLGILLQFELLSYSNLQPFASEDNLAEGIGSEINYKTAIQEIPLKSPSDVISYNYGIYDVTSQHFLEFFQPLEEYLQAAPLVPHPTKTRERKIEIAVPVEITTTKVRSSPVQANATKIDKLETPPVQNDQEASSSVKEAVTENSVETDSALSAHSAGMYVLITIAACFFILVGVVVFKKVVTMRRPRTNNRRFET